MPRSLREIEAAPLLAPFFLILLFAHNLRLEFCLNMQTEPEKRVPKPKRKNRWIMRKRKKIFFQMRLRE